MARREGRVWRESSSERDEGSTGGVVLFAEKRDEMRDCDVSSVDWLRVEEDC